MEQTNIFDINKEIVLKPLQIFALNEIREAMKRSKRIIFQAGTGFGKTIIAAQIMKTALERGKKVVFIADRILLINQTSDVLDDYGIKHGVIQAQNDKFNLHRNLQVCSIQTIKRRGCPQADLIIIDECFEGSTKISTPNGEKEIKSIKVGDYVNNACGVGIVRAISVSSKKILTVRLSNGKTIKCTEGHPFFTHSGWKAAGKLDVGERISGEKDLSSMQEIISSYGGCSSKWERESNTVGKRVAENCNLLELLCQEIEQSYEGQRRSAGETKKINGRTQDRSSWWQRSSECLSRNIMRGSGDGVRDRVHSTNGDKWDSAGNGATPLQDRYCGSRTDDRRRSGWKIAQHDSAERTRCEEGLFAEGIRVESIESEQSGSKNTVYNLEVSRHPSYFAEGVLVHNCHVLFQAHIKIMDENPDAYILGLTATPYSKGLGKHFDFHIQPVPIRELIKNKYLVDFDIFGPSIADLSKLKVRAGEYTEESLTEVFDKVDIIGDVVKTWLKLTPNKKTIVFGANISHLKHIVKSFQEAGISAVQVNAYQPEDEREAALKSFIEGETKVCCSVEVLTKGFDFPAAEVCVLAVATRSMIKFTQTCGRVLRTFPGKEKAIIIDCGGNAERLGFFDQFEFLGLDDGKKKPAKKAESKEKLPKACPSCDYIKPIGVHKCPACGFAPEHIKDVEVSAGELQKLQRKAKREYTVEEKQKFIAQLNQYAAEKGMKPGKGGCHGWAIYAYKDKFGCTPSGKINWAAREPVSEEVTKYIIHRNIRYAHRKNKTQESVCQQ